MTEHETGYEYLTEPRKLKNKILRLQEQRQALEYSLLPGAIRYDNPAVDHSPGDTMATTMGKIDEIDREIIDVKCELSAINSKLYGQIESWVEYDSDKTVLVAYFIGGKTIDNISSMMNYSRAHTYRFWKRGIKDITLALSKHETNETQ